MMNRGEEDRTTGCRRLVLRLTAHWRFKVIASVVITVAFFAAYFLLQNHPLFAVTQLPLTRWDRLIGFHPDAVFLYASLWLYMPLAAWLLDEKRELLAYCGVLTGLCLAGLVVFLFWPTAVPPQSDWLQHPAFRVLASVDGLVNACPSLHATFAVYSALCIQRLFRVLGDRGWFRLLSWCWGLGILYATVATKRHVVIDLLCGVVLGIVGFAVYVRWTSGLRRSSS